MKFPNAILSIATATLGSVSNNNNVADAKLWPLRGGLGKADANEVVMMGKESSPQQQHQPRGDGSSIVESLLHEDLPTPTANLHQGERRLPKKKDKKNKNKGGEKKDEPDEGEEKAPKKKTKSDKKDKGTDTGTENGGKKGKGKKGKKVEKIGEEILVEAPNDVIAKADCYEEFEVEGGDDNDDVSISVRRILKKSGTKGDKKKKEKGEKKVKTKGTKNDKQELISGTCESFATDEDPTEEEIDVAGDDIAVETADNHSCDPDDNETPCEEEGVGEDPTLLPPVDDKGVEVDVTMEEEEDTFQIFSRHLTGNTNHIGDFAPLSCNPVEFDCSGAAGLSSVMGDGEVVVPCGTCLVYDLEEEVTIAGLNIIGKLQVPTNYKSTLYTPYVFVQGELEMSDNQPIISEDNTSMKIVLTGNTDVTFTPHETVEGAPFSAGEKPFLVAGGKLNIRGWDDADGSGKTWTPILGMAFADRPYPEPIVGETAPLTALSHLSDPDITCPNRIVHDFDNGVDYSVWSGGDGGILSYDEESGTLTETNLNRYWQGFRIDFTKLVMDCPITQDVDYLVTIRLKIEDPTLEDGDLSHCETGTSYYHDCPRLIRAIHKGEGESGGSYDRKSIIPSQIGRNNEWFTFATMWSWDETDLDGTIGQVFYLENFRPGQIIHMDEFQFELPSEKSFAPLEDPCHELVVNGDAENADGRGWHYHPMWSHRTDRYIPTILEETEADGSVNKYWHIENRKWHGDSLRFNVNRHCLMQGATYSLSLRSRFSGKTTPERYWFEIKGETPNGFKYNKPLNCPQQSAADGWVTCSGVFVADENYAFIKDPEIIFVTNDENTDTGFVDWDFDDVSIMFQSGPAGGLEVDGTEAARWGANSNVHITSSTLHGDDAQSAVLQTVTERTNGNVELKFVDPIAPVISDHEAPGYGVEIALTSRNIKIVGEDDGTYNGGYLQIFHTPGVAQVLEGVEFLNMGQSSRKNRYAIQLLYSGNVEGTSISSNSIVKTNMRCISVEGTANATIASNVGAEVTGHCFYFDRVSADNMVLDNLASNMNNRINYHNRIHGWDDYDADGFSIWSPFNNFIGNVAAGGHKRGFRWYLDWRTIGEDLENVGGNLRRKAIGTFRDNTAHSNFRQGFHLADFEQFFTFRDPDNVPVFENIKSYRNREQGVWAWNCVNCKFIGGFVSDNQKGLEIRRSDGISVEDFVIQGQTETFKNYVTDNNSHKLCASQHWTYEGIHMMGTMWRLGHQDPGFGLRMKNVAFSGFDKEQEYYSTCPQTEAIGLSADTHYAAHFDYKTSFENVTVDDSRDIILDGCRADGYGYPDIVITDIDGSLDPDQNAASGALISDQPYMKGLLGDSCISTGGCMAYCTGVCLGMFTYFTERFGTENYKLRVTDTATGLSVDIPGNARDYGERWNTYAYDGQRTFSASLPAGDYTAEFVDELGNSVWPTYVEEVWAKPADCDGGVTMDDVTLIQPSIDPATECADMIRNGDAADRSDVTPWMHTKWYGDVGNALKAGEGMNGGNAIYMDRVHHWTGIAQNLNTMCTDAGEGEFYEFSAYLKMTDADGNPSINIDPNREWWRNQSPILTLNDRQYRDWSTKEFLYTAEHRDLANLVRPYNNAEFGRVHGIFKMRTSPRIWVEVERAPDHVKFLLDNASITPFACSRDNLVKNGNLETGDSLYWDTWGGDLGLEVVPDIGPNGSAALKTSAPRGWYDRSQAQILNTECVNEGDRIAFSAKIKSDDNCLIYSWDYNQRCNNLHLYTNKNGMREYNRVGTITADTPDADGWHHVHGIYVTSENGAKPDLAKMYFADANPNWDVYTADVKAYVLEQNCQALVENSNFEDKDLFWTYTDRDRSKVKVIPGADGTGHALRSYDRDHSWRGLMQTLDSRCFVAGEEFDISAKFRLTDENLAGVECDPNFQYNYLEGSQCPSVVLYGKKCASGNVYQQFWNAASDKTWDPEGWNSYETSFVVNEELAACDLVEVWIHQINRNWNIEVDSVQIDAMTTLAPTLAPTDTPTFLDETTLSPTVSPTAMPSLTTTTVCPPSGEYVELLAGPVMLERSNTLCIITKAIVDSDGTHTEVAPVARSSNGGNWEKHAGDFAETLLYGQTFNDYTEGCQITLPELAPGEKYFITSYASASSRRLTEVDEERKAVARLMQQASFGTTLADLDGWSKGPVTKDTAAEWVKEQMQLPLTSHREYFRKRLNPRLTNPVRIGRNNHPCSANARWRSFTFSRKDGSRHLEQFFEAEYNGAVDHAITIKLNGFVRTTVKSIGFADATIPFEFNKEYPMCHEPQERIGGWFWLRLDDGSCSHLANPGIEFYENTTQPAYVLNLPNASGNLMVIDSEHTSGQELINTASLDDTLCSSLNDITEEGDAPIHGRLDNGTYVLFDPRLVLDDNTVENPIPDGGGLVKTLTGDATKCANAPRTFLNEDSCVLSYESTACSSSTAPDLLIELNADNLQVLHDLTGQYVYGMLGMPVVDAGGEKLESPCTPGLRSRWEIKDAGECTQTALQPMTNATLAELLHESSDSNTFIRDINFPNSGFTCDSADDDKAEFEIIIGSQCFKRVHHEHMSVFDFTYWTLDHTHPGNMVAMMEGEPNPIKKWRDIDESAFLIFPSFPPAGSDIPPHPLERWVTYGEKFPKLGRFGDVALFVDLPNEMRTDEVAEYFGESAGLSGSGVVVCGSPGEVANDPTLGKYFVPVHEKGTDWGLDHQKLDIFFNIALTANDQLRQRVAFALSQVLVVVEAAISIRRDHTEAFVSYHDILVRNAFGNYLDILKQISYNPLMAEHLSFLQSKSTAHMWEHQERHAFADENFAREIMQLFSTGLYMLNKDGSHKLDENGEWINAYTNDEIMSFARVWTGFDYQQGRGSMEDNTWFGNRVDPMRIEASWRDKFPKTDMTGGYLGDGYPLCVDLPDKMWLRKGAKYRLLGSKHTPELMEDDPAFQTDLTMKKFVLESASNLKGILCNANASGDCQYAVTVTLESSIACTGKECDADTARVIDVGEGIYYEYVSPPCVEQAFYSNAKKVIFKNRLKDSSCANPLLPYASEACCSVADVAAYRNPEYIYDQERVLFSTAEARCEAMGKQMCDFNYVNDLDEHKKGYHWTSDSCKIQVKVDATGQTALVYKPNSFNHLHPHIDQLNRNYFKVYWDNDFPRNDNDGPDGNSCGNGACDVLETGGCLCETDVTESRVFSRMPTSADEVFSKLTIGAFDTSAYDAGTYSEGVTENDVTVYFKAGEGFTADTVFEVTDKNRRSFRFKNSMERVRVKNDSSYSFRNPPSFMSVLNTESTAGKAAYETDAALEHYFYHDNTAPFLALRMIQRMVTSNPSPGYIEAVAEAFTSGQYMDIGSGNYGDMAAMVAAVILEPQARDVTLDKDPFDGAFVEPILQLTRLSRGLEITPGNSWKLVYFDTLKDRVGQAPYAYDTVFSFFLPEYEPDGTTKVGQASLVAPEAVALDAPKTVELMNGLFSLVKYGLNRCYGGFNHWWGSCTENEDFTYSHAHLTHEMPWIHPEAAEVHAANVISELSLILTGDRLSASNTDLITSAYLDKLPTEGHSAAHRLAVQLILTTPEFHTSQTSVSSGVSRPEPEEPVPSGEPYKAIVMVMLAGGADSFNMLVPHTCTGAKDMYQEYNDVRLDVALPKEDLIELNNVPNQVCEKFGVHSKYVNVANMFNSGDLSWFTNTGVLDKETTKHDYWRDTVTQLFAHNWMQLAAQKADPFKDAFGTGILGRIRDAAKNKGRSVGAFSIDWGSAATNGMPGVNPSALILNRNGVTMFNENPSDDDMVITIKQLNNEFTPESGAFSDLWSDHFTTALANNERLYNTLSVKTTVTEFPNEHLSRQLEMVAKMIDSRDERGVDGDLYYCSKGGFDTHMNTLANTDVLFGDLDEAYGAFRQEMEAKGIWDKVTLITVSDFARTLNPNGNAGVDHAWGGNYVMMGGSVKGGQIHGEYPDNLTDDGERMLQRGRAIPTTGWEVVFKATAEWFGVGADDMPDVLPNMGSFTREEYWIPTADVFNMA